MARRRSAPTSLTPQGHLDEANLQQVLGYQLAQATIVTDALFTQCVGLPLQLRRVEYTLLMLVAQNPGGSAAGLARALAVTPPNVAVILDRLEARKLIERSACADDRRSYRLSVTPGGGALAREATKRIVAAERSRSGLTPGEQAILAELLHKIACARQAVAQTQASSAEGVAP
jgi:DNA-binding MarR family transcriptional regulator